MADRLTLHALLKDILSSDRVYFQPPPSVLMKYPAIRYAIKTIDNTFADNSVYKQDDAYEITVIDANPDSEYFRKVSHLPKCRFDRFYTADNLNHWTFTKYI